MTAGRDDEKTWAELVEAFHASPDPEDARTQRWPEAENIDSNDTGVYDDHTDPYRTTPGDVAWPSVGSVTDRGGAAVDDGPEHGRWNGEGADGATDAGTGATAGQAEPDHFVPPVPPPMPRGDRVSRWAWGGMIAAPASLLLSSITRWSPPEAVMAVIIGGFVAGFVTLVSRMRGRNPHDPDNGAVV